MKQESFWEYLSQKEENYGSVGWGSKGYGPSAFLFFSNFGKSFAEGATRGVRARKRSLGP